MKKPLASRNGQGATPSTSACPFQISNLGELNLVPIERQEFTGDMFTLGFASVPGTVYEVEQCEWPGRPITTSRVKASAEFTAFRIDAREKRSTSFFNVRGVQPEWPD